MLPQELIFSLQDAVGFDKTTFEKVHEEAFPPVSIRINPSKWAKTNKVLPQKRVPWCQTAYYLPTRPVFTLDPLLHAGCYYVQEASSMFLEEAVKKAINGKTDINVLDLCAAPGGKSTHLLSLLPENSVLVSNEVIQSRASILLENLIKWGSVNGIVTQNDPSAFGKLGPVFDLVCIDAPCSGSGLFRRDPQASLEWSLQAVSLCSKRQQRILADVYPALVAGGYLIYSTCSYSIQENEDILDWLSDQFQMEGVALDWNNEQEGVIATNSPKSGIPCYRFYPGKVNGEGFFIALLRKKDAGNLDFPRETKRNPKQEKLPVALRPWIIEPEIFEFFQHKEHCFLMTKAVSIFFQHLKTNLNIRKAGLKIAEEVHGKFIPTHDLALSNALNEKAFYTFEVSLDSALSFLRKETFDIPEYLPMGWLLVKFDGLPLGLLKNLGNRFNNYYPKDWRIRMLSPKN